jgi:hypothetical protein
MRQEAWGANWRNYSAETGGFRADRPTRRALGVEGTIRVRTRTDRGGAVLGSASSLPASEESSRSGLGSKFSPSPDVEGCGGRVRSLVHSNRFASRLSSLDGCETRSGAPGPRTGRWISRCGSARHPSSEEDVRHPDDEGGLRPGAHGGSRRGRDSLGSDGTTPQARACRRRLGTAAAARKPAGGDEALAVRADIAHIEGCVHK